jgi:hypothetical protein
LVPVNYASRNGYISQRAIPHTRRKAVVGQLHTQSRVCAAKVTRASRNAKEKRMLWTIFVILLVLWLLGLVTSYTLGGFIHILLIVAIATLLIQLFTGRRTV